MWHHGRVRYLGWCMSDQVPSPADLQRVLNRLDAFVHAPGTIALHDVLYRMLKEPDPAHVSALVSVLAAHPSHPLRREIEAELSPWLAGVPQSLEDVLLQDGPLPDTVDPVQEVRRRLSRAREVRRVLEERILSLERQGRTLYSTAYGMAAVAAFLAVFSVMGWLAALGFWEIPWLDPPTLEPPGTAPEPVME